MSAVAEWRCWVLMEVEGAKLSSADSDLPILSPEFCWLVQSFRVSMEESFNKAEFLLRPFQP